MKLRNAFLSKLVFAVLAGTQFSSATLAQVSAHDFGGSGGYVGPVHESDYKQLEAAILQNPHATLKTVTAFVNKSFMKLDNGMRKFEITVKYHSQLPKGKTSYFELVQTSSASVNLQFNVHEAAKHNPFFLLEALIQLRAIYNLNSIGYQGDPQIIYGHKQHPSHHHGPMIDVKFTEYSLKKTLGLPNTLNITTQPELTPMELLEISANAKAGSPFAQRHLAEKDANDFELLKRGFQSFQPLQKLSEASRTNALRDFIRIKGLTSSPMDSYEVTLKKYIDQTDLQNKKQLDALNSFSKKAYRQQVNAYKAGAAERELIVQGPALNEMIKANDRQGVAAAMEKMLPWEIMEPSEKIFWSDFVDSIRHPNYKNAQILFRGIDAEEKFQAIKDASGKIVGGGLLSKRLTAGSGSHFFKLKGLPETFETFGTYGGSMGGKRISPLNRPHTLTAMMTNHSISPNGSPFVSLTYSLQTAYNFATAAPINAPTKAQFEAAMAKSLKSNASGGLATIRIDPRRLLINSLSTYTTELEVLASMFVFPDEVIHLEKGVRITGVTEGSYFAENRVPMEDYYARARKSVFEKTGIQLPEDHLQYELSGRENFINGIKNIEALYTRTKLLGGGRCEYIFK